ncbi:EAL domain-containing protein [Sulfurospirillum arcachonense]|uniref:EAL domain-containing protein n=1 Tax=Sulfurospirillum arcachonense TaxID=57666 RepID=UPI00046A5697|nr:EAL domain-containing protein [Sulfurospirillum arcachonense]
MRNKFFIKNPIYLIYLIVTVVIILLLLLYGTIKLEEKVEKKMFEISTSDVLQIARNNAKIIGAFLKNSNNYVKDIKYDVMLRGKIENQIESLPTKNIKYAYLLYRDSKGTFRFLADASKPSEKAFLNQKFDVTSSKWNEIYDKKEPFIIKQPLLKELSISYLVPILYKEKVELILAIDFSIKKVENINNIISLMKKAILAMIGVIIVFGLILVVQTFRYFIVKKTAYVDKLTNVFNRNYLQELQEFINLHDYVLATLDIDHFKKVNDTYGHNIGDLVLKEIAKLILKTSRKKHDIVIRYGGEEFVILLKTKRNDKLSALNVIEKIFTTIQENKFYISPLEYIYVTVSIGVNLVPYKSRTFSEAFRLADIALYNVKDKGRNAIEIYEEKDRRKNNANMSISEINAAIEENRVICYFQQIVETQSKKLSHYEALLRIIDKNGNIITPDKILPSIRGTFILRNITKIVLDICYKRLLSNDDVYINVNLNPQDIVNESILNILNDYAQIDNISNRMGLEIVESEDIINYSDAKENLLMLKKLGYKIFIDDFGSGYSNFIYLTEIQTDFIKLDGNIIKKIVEDKVSFLVVKSIVNFAKEANIKVIAEYVCNEEIYKIIKTLGIEYSQGYLFSTPKLFEEH